MSDNWGCSPLPGLDALLKKSAGYVMSPEEKYEQRISFIFGMLSSRSTLTKADVRRIIKDMEGEPE